MKMMWIVYDVDMEEEVMEALGRAEVEQWTLWERVLGRGSRSGPNSRPMHGPGLTACPWRG